jgi:hypothetical protein
MRLPLTFVLAFLCAVGFVIAGVYFVRDPEKVYRVVSFGQAPNRAGVTLVRAIGWFYICGGAIGAVMFLAGTVLALIHSR